MSLLQRYDLIAGAAPHRSAMHTQRSPASARPNTSSPLQFSRADPPHPLPYHAAPPSRKSPVAAHQRSSASADPRSPFQPAARGADAADHSDWDAAPRCPVHRHPCAPLLLCQDSALASCVDARDARWDADGRCAKSSREMLSSVSASPQRLDSCGSPGAGARSHSPGRRAACIAHTPPHGATACPECEGCHAWERREEEAGVHAAWLQARVERLEREVQAATDKVHVLLLWYVWEQEDSSPLRSNAGHGKITCIWSSPIRTLGHA